VFGGEFDETLGSCWESIDVFGCPLGEVDVHGADAV
jgi:hypothetical protein